VTIASLLQALPILSTARRGPRDVELWAWREYLVGK
jgi:hypothetical protein